MQWRQVNKNSHFSSIKYCSNWYIFLPYQSNHLALHGMRIHIQSHTLLALLPWVYNNNNLPWFRIVWRTVSKNLESIFQVQVLCICFLYNSHYRQWYYWLSAFKELTLLLKFICKNIYLICFLMLLYKTLSMFLLLYFEQIKKKK